LSFFAFKGPFARLLLLVLAALNVMGFATAAVVGWAAASIENGPIEDVQLFVLFASFLAGIFGALRSRRLLRAVMWCWTALMLLMLQREFDFTAWGTDSWIYQLRSMSVRLSFWIPVVLILAALLGRHTQDLLRAIRAVRLVHVWPVVLVAVIMVASNASEHIAKTPSEWTNIFVFLEEQLELNAYGVIASMGLAFASRLRATVPPAVADARNRLDPAA
jgi:hypothetical protein